MTDIPSTARVSAPWIVDASVMPAPDDSGWTWADIGILGWIFAAAVSLPTCIIVWALT